MLWDSVLWDSVLWDFVRRDFVLWDFVLWDSVRIPTLQSIKPPRGLIQQIWTLPTSYRGDIILQRKTY